MAKPFSDCDYLLAVWPTDTVQQELLTNMHDKLEPGNFRTFCIQLQASGGFAGVLESKTDFETLIQDAFTRDRHRTAASGTLATASAASDTSCSVEDQHGIKRKMRPP